MVRSQLKFWTVSALAFLPIALANTGCLCCKPEFTPPPDVPSELQKVLLPPYIVEPPDVLLVEAIPSLPDQPIGGPHLVRPDGSIGLGIYGSVQVGGLTLDEAREAIQSHLASRIKREKLQVSVDVIAYNSKAYYVITDGGGYGEQVYRFPIMGSETVLDAIGQIYGLPAVASKRHIWLARRVPGCSPDQEQIFPIDWCAITQHGITNTNWQVLPGDRIYVQADCWVTADSIIAKVLSPYQRIMGAILLTSETINSIKGSSGGTGGGGG